MTAWLTLFTSLAVLALLATVAVQVVRIVRELEAIGGTPTSYLAKIRFGLRAIETETGHLGPEVGRLNAALAALGEGLQAVDRSLVGVLANLRRGGGA